MQVVVLSITDKHREYAVSVLNQLRAAGYRAEADLRNEKVGFKIREAEKAKIPYMLVVGDREMQSGTVSVRGRTRSNLGSMSVAAVLDLLGSEAAPPAQMLTH
ncbi:MAG: hypothetical protein KatS3mg082_2253 [Nitrospiraceae bacterium]|nr:MAG: hypothetical protein KatS3mg082_2253 [Nitrospiraceae bacterium]